MNKKKKLSLNGLMTNAECQYPLEVAGRTFKARFVAWIGSTTTVMLQCSDGAVRELSAHLLTKDGVPILEEKKDVVSI
ncbi:MAG: hypothetical protein DRN30_03170 [Thermoplasmata archaeon]|nr:MAG: hypothetical protein DRN30_03170 [Thermoplasmata archaeon]